MLVYHIYALVCCRVCVMHEHLIFCLVVSGFVLNVYLIYILLLQILGFILNHIINVF